jgi:flagellar biosynthesis/type III secretory pathway protein FliH
MRQRREHRVELRLRLMETVLRFVRAEEYQSLLLDAIETYYRLSRAERRTQAALLQSGQFGGLTEMAETVLERLQARARRKALEEGRQEGAIEAMRAAIKQVIATRFPETPHSLMAQVDRIQDVSVLEELHHRAIVAAGPEEIEGLVRSAAG